MAEKPVNKKTFDVVVEGQKRQLSVVRPTNATTQKATLVYNRAWKEAVEAGSITASSLERHLRKTGLWDDAQQAEFETLSKRIRDAERRMLGGGMKRSELQELGLELRRMRLEQRQMLARRNEEEAKTAESFARQSQFNFFVSACTLDEEGKPYYAGVDDYVNRADDPVGLPAAQKLGELLYDLDPNFERNLPENKLMRKYGIVDDDLHLINRQGKRCDVKGRLVDDQGRFIDEDGHFVDVDGNRLTEDGEYEVEFKPILDDDGTPLKPVDEPKVELTRPPTKKKPEGEPELAPVG